jgi:pyruvate formate-lyase activating enzyme-like uncharacterized protein
MATQKGFEKDITQVEEHEISEYTGHIERIFQQAEIKMQNDDFVNINAVEIDEMNRIGTRTRFELEQANQSVETQRHDIN